MYLLEIKIADVIRECPFVKEWIDLINTYIKKVNFPISKIESYYDYGFFVPESKNTPEQYSLTLQKNLTLKYDDRLEQELSKIRVTVTIKMGNTILTHKLPKGFIPQTITEIIAEVTKVRMKLECDEHGNEEVRDSIPPPSPHIIIDYIDNTPKIEPEFEIDDILDKISKSGYDSLTKEERQFLDRKSKDI